MSDDTITLDREAVKAIRHALTVGLSCYGEIERVLSNVKFVREYGNAVPDDVIPLHPTGSDHTIGEFADAFAYLNL